MKNIVLVLLFSFLATTFVSAQAKQTQKEMFQPVYNTSKSIVKSQDYQFVADVIYDGEKREKLDASNNQITISDTKISGQLHSFSKKKTIHTLQDENSRNSTSFNDEKQHISIVINTNAYKIYIDVKPNGNAFLTLSDNDNASLTFTGKLLKL